MAWHLLSVPEVAQLCGLSEKAVRRAIDDGELAASKLRSRLRIRPEDVEAWICTAARSHGTQVTPRRRPRPRSVGPFRTLMREEPDRDESP